MRDVKSWQIDVIGGLLLSVVTAAAVGGGLMPLRGQLLATDELRREVSDSIASSAAVDAELRDLEEQVERTNAALAACEVDLKPIQQLNAHLAAMTELIGASGMEIRETDLGVRTSDGWFQLVPIRLVGSGSYSDCATFLHRLRARLPDTGVVAFELSGNPGNPAATSTFRLDLVWYAAPAVAVVPDS